MSGSHQSAGDILADVCDGDYYKNHPVFQRNDRALQIIAYYDELVWTNPLMSRAKKYKTGKAVHVHMVAIRHYN